MKLSNTNTYDELSPSIDIISKIRPDIRVAFILMEKFTLAPVSGLVESLRFAADKSFRSLQIYCKWSWITVNNQSISASCGLSVNSTTAFNLDDLKKNYDYIVVAGGLLTETREPPAHLIEALQELHKEHIPIIALCSGCFVLAKAGLLKNKRCAIHFTTRDEFAQKFPDVITVIDQNYVEDQGIFTCPGGTAIDLATHLIRHHCGNIRAQKTLDYLLIKEYKDHKNTQLETSSTYENPMFLKAISYMKENLSSHITLKHVADYINTNPRQLHRIFLANTNESPANYWRKIRLDHSRKLLSNTNQYIINIAIDCGFADASHFSLWFKKQYGETPFAYRKRRHEAEKLK